MPALSVLALALSVSPPAILSPALSVFAGLDTADEKYQFIAGLSEKGLHEMVVREASAFLAEYSEHQKATLARYRLATALFDLERGAEAREEFALLARVRGFEFRDEVDFRLGQCELEREAFDEAARALERVVERGEKEYLAGPATFLLAEARFRGGDFAAAEKTYAAVLETPQAETYARDVAHGLAWCAFRQEHYADTARRAADFLARFGDDARADELRFLLGESELEAGHPQPAFEAFAAVSAGAFHDAALRGAGFARAALEDHAGSADWFGRLVSGYPASPYVAEASLHRGIHLLKAGDAEAALAALAIPPAEQSAEVLYWRARSLFDLGRHEDALGELERAEQLSPAEELAGRIQVARGDALYELGRGDEAARAYEAGGSDYALHAAAVAKLNDGDAAEAVRLAGVLLERASEGPFRFDALLALGEGRFALGEHAAAEPAFREIVAKDTDPERRSRALARLGWCRYLTGDPEGAAALFRRVREEHASGPEASEATFMEGRALEEAGRDEEARAAYGRYLAARVEGVEGAPAADAADAAFAIEASLRLARLEDGVAGEARLASLLERAPADALAPQAHYDLAERLSARGEHEAAASHYREILQSFPDSPLVPGAAYGLAWARYSLAQHPAAVEVLDALLARDDLEADLRVGALELSIWCRVETGDTGGARAAFSAFLGACADEPRRLRAAQVVAAGLVAAGDRAAADQVYTDLLAVTREREVAVGACVERCYLALDESDTEAAEKQARTAQRYAADDPAVAEALFFVGEAWFEAGADARAVEAYTLAAAAAEPEVAERAVYKCGFALLRSGANDPAAQAFQTLVVAFPESALSGESLFLAGEAHYRAGRYAEAVEWLERARREAPQHEVMPKVLFRLGLARAHTDAWSEAADVLALLVRTGPDFPNLLEAELWRGRALARTGKERAARQALQRVATEDKGLLSAQARLELGDIALAAGEHEDALAEYLKVALLYAHEDEVAEALYKSGRVLEQQGKPDLARERYEEALEKGARTPFAAKARERLGELGK